MSKMIELLDEELDLVSGAWGGFGDCNNNTIVVSIVLDNSLCNGFGGLGGCC